MKTSIWGFLCFYVVFSAPQVSLSDEAIYSDGIYTDPYSSSGPINNPDNFEGESNTPETEQLHKTPQDIEQNEDESNTVTDINPDEIPNRRKGSYKVVMKQTYKIREPVRYNVSRIVKTKVTRSRPVVHKIYQSRYGYSNPGGALTKIEYTGDASGKYVDVDGASLSTDPKSIQVDGKVEMEKYDVKSDVTKNAPHIGVNEMGHSKVLRSQNLQNYNALELFKQNYDGLTSGRGLLLNSQSYSYPMEPKHSVVNYNLNSDSELVNNKGYYEQVFHKKSSPELLNTNNYVYNSGLQVSGQKYPKNYWSRWYQSIQTINDNNRDETENKNNIKLNSAQKEYSTELSEFGKRLVQVNNYLNNHIPESNKNILKSIDDYDNHQKPPVPLEDSSNNYMSKSSKKFLKSIDDYDNHQSPPVPLIDSSIYTIKYGGGQLRTEVNDVEEGEPHGHVQFNLTWTTVPPLRANSEDITNSKNEFQMQETKVEEITPTEISESTIVTDLPITTSSEYGHNLNTTTSDVPNLRENIPIVSTETDGLNLQPLEKEDDIQMLNENRAEEPEEPDLTEKFTDWTQSRHALQFDENDITGRQKSKELRDHAVANEDLKLLMDYSGESLKGLGDSLSVQASSKVHEILSSPMTLEEKDNPKILRSGRGEIFDRNLNSSLLLENVPEVRNSGKEIEEINGSATLAWEIAHKIDTSSAETSTKTDDNETETLLESPNLVLSRVSELRSGPVKVLGEINENPTELRSGLDNTLGDSIESLTIKKIIEINTDSGETLDTVDDSPSRVFEKVHEVYSGYGESIDKARENPKELHSFVKINNNPVLSLPNVYEINSNSDGTLDTINYSPKRGQVSNIYSEYGNVLVNTKEKPEILYSALHNTVDRSNKSPIWTPPKEHDMYSGYGYFLDQTKNSPLLRSQNVYTVSSDNGGNLYQTGDSSSRVLEQVSEFYSDYGKILDKTNETPKQPGLGNALYITNETPISTSQKVHEVNTDTGKNLDKIDDGGNGILQKLSELYSSNGDILYDTNKKPKDLNYDLVNTSDKTNESPLVTLQNIYEVNSDKQTLDEINVNPNEVLKNVSEDLSVTENTSVSISQSETNQVLPEIEESHRELDIPSTETNGITSHIALTEANSDHPAQTEKNDKLELEVKITDVNIQTDLTKNLRVNKNVPDLLAETEAHSHKQAEPEHKSNAFESAWTLLPLDYEKTINVPDGTVEVPDNNARYFPNPKYMHEPRPAKTQDILSDTFPIDHYGYGVNENDGPNYPEMGALRTREITYTTVNLPSPNHYEQDKLNYELDDDSDDGANDLVQLCKLARTNLHRLRKLVAKNYGLNTKTAEESDLITIVYIMGTLNEAKKTDMPVENIVDDLHVNLRRLGELRKLLCKDIDAIDQTILLNFGENVETIDDINFDANILTLFDKYLSGKKYIIDADHGFGTNPDSMPDLVENKQQKLFTIKPHSVLYTKKDLYITRPDVETASPNLYISVDENNAFLTNLNTQPDKTNYNVNIDKDVFDTEPEYTENTHKSLYTIAPDYTDNIVKKLYPVTTNYRENENKNLYPIKPGYIDKVSDKLYTVPPDYTDDINRKTYTIYKNMNPVTPVYDEHQSVYEPVYTENIHENLYTIEPDYFDNIVQNLNSIIPNYRVKPDYLDDKVGDELYTLPPENTDNVDRNAYTVKDYRNPVIYDENVDQNVYDIEPIATDYTDNVVQKLYSITPIEKQNVYPDIPGYIDEVSKKMYTIPPDYTEDKDRNAYTINKNMNPGTPVYDEHQNVYDIEPVYPEKTHEDLYTIGLDYTDNILQNLNSVTPNYQVKPGYVDDGVSGKYYTQPPDYTDDVNRNAYTINANRNPVTPVYDENIDQNVPDYTEITQEKLYTIVPKHKENEKQIEISVKPGYANDISDKLYTSLPDYTDDIDTYTIDQNKYPDTSIYVDKTDQDVYNNKPEYAELTDNFSLSPKPDYIVNLAQHLYPDYTENLNNNMYTEKPDYTDNINQNEYTINENTDHYLYSTEPGYTDEISQEFYPKKLKNTQNNIYPIKPRLYQSVIKNSEPIDHSVPDSMEFINEHLFAIKQNKYPLILDIERTNEKYPVESDLESNNEKMYTTLPDQDYVEDDDQNVKNANYLDNQYISPLRINYIEETNQNVNPLGSDNIENIDQNVYTAKPKLIERTNELLHFNQPDVTDKPTKDQNYSVDENKNPARQGSKVESLPNLYPKKSDLIENIQNLYTVMPDYVEKNNENLFNPEYTKNTNEDFYTDYTDVENYSVSPYKYPVKGENLEDQNWNPPASGDLVYEPEYADNVSVDQYKYNVRPADILKETNQNLYKNPPIYTENIAQTVYTVRPDYKIPERNLYETKPEYTENTYEQFYVNQPYNTENIDKTSYSVNQYKNPDRSDYFEKINQFYKIEDNLGYVGDYVLTNQDHGGYSYNNPQNVYPFKPVVRDQTKDTENESPKPQQEDTLTDGVKLPNYITNNKYQASPNTLTGIVSATEKPVNLQDIISTTTHITKESYPVNDSNKPDITKNIYPVNDGNKPDITKNIYPLNDANKPDITKNVYPVNDANKLDITKNIYPVNDGNKPDITKDANKPGFKTSQNVNVDINLPIKSSTNKPETYDVDVPGDYYKQLLEELKQFNFVQQTETPKNKYRYNIDIWDLNKKPNNWNSENWLNYQDTTLKKPEHFKVHLNNKKLTFWPGNHDQSAIETLYGNDIRINGYLQKVDLETLVNVAHYQSTGYDSELVPSKELSLLLEVRDKVDITIVTNVIWNEILRLRMLGASEERINQFVQKLITTVLPYAFRDTQKCHTTILRHLLSSIKQLENNEI